MPKSKQKGNEKHCAEHIYSISQSSLRSLSLVLWGVGMAQHSFSRSFCGFFVNFLGSGNQQKSVPRISQLLVFTFTPCRTPPGTTVGVCRWRWNGSDTKTIYLVTTVRLCILIEFPRLFCFLVRCLATPYLAIIKFVSQELFSCCDFAPHTSDTTSRGGYGLSEWSEMIVHHQMSTEKLYQMVNY